MSETVKLGSKEWFKGLADQLVNAGMVALTNSLTARKTASGSQTDQNKSVQTAGFSLSWLPYAVAGAFVLVLVLVFRKS
jgi:hypothetical protein